jgi:SAM-dependent methyltransferase
MVSGADPEALARVLRHLVQHGVFTEPRPGQFAANQTAALLRTGQPGAVWLDLDGFGGRMDLAFTGLVHTVHTGEPAWEQVFGQPFWAYLDANPPISASFDATMAVDAANAAVADGYDWTTVRHVADIGGGTGTLIAEVLRRNPRLRGTLADLPETAARARQYLSGLGLDGRCEVVGQSFFDPLPAGADAYLLSRVIHDWDDAAASAILRRCAEAAGSTRPGARDRIARHPRRRPHRVRGDEPAHAGPDRWPRAHHRRLLSPRRRGRPPGHRGARYLGTLRDHRVCRRGCPVSLNLVRDHGLRS